MSEELERRFVSDEMKESYINYAMSVLLAEHFQTSGTA